MSEQPSSPTFGAAMSAATASALNSRTGRTIAALFILFQIYLLGVTPIWIGTLELKKMFAELQVAREEAAAATERQASEATAIAENVKVKLAEAQNAADLMRAEAEKAEAEARTAREVASAAPERQQAEANAAIEKAKIRLGQALAARDQAKADADKTEAEARKTIAEAQIARQSAQAEIMRIKKSRAVQENALKTYIGAPLPDFSKL